MKGDVPPLVAVILAAGASVRLGEPKQLVRLAGERLLDRAVRVGRSAGLIPIVVLGSSAERIAAECDFAGCQVVHNPRWKQGMAASIRAGIERAEALSATAALLMTCDQPAVTAEHLLRLAEEGTRGGEVVASCYAERRGVPAFFPASRFAALMRLRGDAGAREMLQRAAAVDLPSGDLDIDTIDSLRLAKSLFARE